MRTTSGESGSPAPVRLVRIVILLVLVSLILPGATARLAGPEPDPPTPGRVAALPPPHLRYPDAQPLPLPVVDPETWKPKGEAGDMISYDLRDGTVTRQPSVSIEDMLGPRYTEAGIGVLELLDDPDLVRKNFSDWSLVPDATVGTYPRRVKMWMRFIDTNGQERFGAASGTLIDPQHVLTAGHCVFMHENEAQTYTVTDFADSVTIAPAYRDGEYPFGYVEAVSLHTWNGWFENQDYDYDVGLVDLAWPVGALTGTFGYGHHPDSDWFLQGVWYHAAYSAEGPFTGEQMSEAIGTYDTYHDFFNRASWDNWSYGGSSGGGAVRDDIVWAVHSTGSDEEPHSTDCLIDDFMFTDIGTWIAQDTPAAVDFVPLWVRGDSVAWSDSDLDPLTFVITNYSIASWSGSISYDVYLSANDQISVYDTQIASAGVTADIGPKGSVTVAMPTIHVPAVVAGQYWLGVVIDETDANASNNDSSGWQAMPLEVRCRIPSPPALDFPTPGIDCRDPDSVTFDWWDMDGAAEYELLVGDSCWEGDRFFTTVSQFTHPGLEWGTEYRWRVRQRSACSGEWGDWSTCGMFTTTPDPAEAPAPVYPVHATHCVPPDTTLTWDDFPYAVGYEVQVGTECGSGGVQATDVPELGVSLRAGREYYWRMRTETDCGDWNDWSECYRFRTSPDTVAVPEIIVPYDGSTCAGIDAVLTWMPDTEAAGWEVEFGTACGTGTRYPNPDNSLIMPGLSGGVDYVWRVRMFHECGLTSEWTPCHTFQVDTVPPIGASNLHGVSHEVDVWSPANEVSLAWDPGQDDCGAVVYSLLWDEVPDTSPDDTPDWNMPGYTSWPLADGGNHWFHLATFDPPGNRAVGDLHLGPFRIDATPPDAVEIIYTTVDPGSAGGHPSVWCAWLAATDETSGTAGYSWVLDPSQLAQPDTSVETSELWDRERFAAEGSWYFQVAAVDRAGNLGTQDQVGPFIVDLGRIGGEMRRPNRQDLLVEGQSFPVTWNLTVPIGRTVVGGALSYSTNAGLSWHAIGNLNAAQVLAGSQPWIPPAYGTTLGALRLQIYDQYGLGAVIKSELFAIQQVSATRDVPPPARFALVGNAPNPFNPRTTIVYDLPRASAVSLRIYDLRGRLIRNLVREFASVPRRYEVTWDGTDERGRRVAGGVYFYRLEAGAFQDTKRMTLVK